MHKSMTSMKHLFLLIAAAIILGSCATATILESPAVEEFEMNTEESLLDAVEAAGFQTLEEDNYHIHSASDEDFLYIVMEVRSRSLHQRIEDYGFQVTVESGDNWLGLTYPMGMIEALRDFQDAAVNYIMDPSWDQMPQNDAAAEQAEEDFHNRALLTQSQDDSPVQISLTELQAQNVWVEIQDMDGFYTLAYSIPLQSGRSQQFSPDAAPGEMLSIEISIAPPSAEELTGEDLTGAGGGSDFGGDMMGGGQRQGQGQQQQQEEESLADRVDRMLGREYSNSFQLQLP